VSEEQQSPNDTCLPACHERLMSASPHCCSLSE
jgi:hypothetical protein